MNDSAFLTAVGHNLLQIADEAKQRGFEVEAAALVNFVGVLMLGDVDGDAVAKLRTDLGEHLKSLGGIPI